MKKIWESVLKNSNKYIPSWLRPDPSERQHTGITRVRSCTGADELCGDSKYLPISPNTKFLSYTATCTAFLQRKAIWLMDFSLLAGEAIVSYSSALNWRCLPIEFLLIVCYAAGSINSLCIQTGYDWYYSGWSQGECQLDREDQDHTEHTKGCNSITWKLWTCTFYLNLISAMRFSNTCSL